MLQKEFGPFCFVLIIFIYTGCTPLNVKTMADYTDEVVAMDFVFVQGGTFIMGDISGQGFSTERPAHEVTVPTFYMGRSEVTFDQYDQYCEATSSKKPADYGMGRGDHPVVGVTWDDAVGFAEWLSKQSGRTFRLPSEAEWEYAARGGTTTEYWWGDDFRKGRANCQTCPDNPFDNMTAPVGSFSANPWGLYDTAGNVAEWIMDNRIKGYKGAPVDGSPRMDGSPRDKVIRGGSYLGVDTDLRSSERSWENKEAVSKSIGFRLVLEPEPAPTTPQPQK